MDTLASLYSRGHRAESNPRPARQHDLFMYQLILGKPVEIVPPTSAEPQAAALRPSVRSLVRRAWTQSVQISHRLRQMWRQRRAEPETQPQVQPQMAGWLRHLSEEAFRRLDEAQVRLSQPRHRQARRRVESREVMSIRPVEHDYKRVA